MSQARPRIEAQARALGFDHVRVAAPAPLPMEHYDAMLREGRHAGLRWLEERDARADPRRLLPGVRSVIVLGFSYGGAVPPDPGGLTGRVARYAWGSDYHNLVLKRLRKLQRWVGETFGGDSYSAVDNRPVFERAWAARAGLGWAAKNACQVIPSAGSWFFLAVLYTELELEPDDPVDDHCGRCARCVTGCPTGALRGDGALDARLCISYWTIEADGPIPEALRPKMGRWLFGCDDCQDLCPHSRDAEIEDALRPRHAWLDAAEILGTADDDLVARFTGTPLRRASPRRLKRNAAIVLANLGDRAAVPALRRAGEEGDAVGDAARWALERL